MSYSTGEIWFLILALGVGTYLIRFSFLGFIGNRQMPVWVLRLLRYAPVAVLPGMVAPLVLWPAATGGVPDAARGGAALVAIAMGIALRSTFWAMASGAATLYGLLFLGL